VTAASSGSGRPSDPVDGVVGDVVTVDTMPGEAMIMHYCSFFFFFLCLTD
jgi:hypothetical protein